MKCKHIKRDSLVHKIEEEAGKGKKGHGRDRDEEENQLTGRNKNYLWEINYILLDKSLIRLWAWVEEDETLTNA